MTTIATTGRPVSFDAKLAGYALAGSALLFAAATPSQAALIIVNPDPKPTVFVPSGDGGQFLELDMDGDGIIDIAFIAVSSFNSETGETVDAVFAGAPEFNFITGTYSSCNCYAYATNFLTPGAALGSTPSLTKAKLLVRYTSIDPDTYQPVFDFYGEWPNGINLSGIMGVSFLLGGVTPTNGFIDISVELASASVTINQWGYNTSDVPEPSTMAMFALGAAGIAALRRRKAQ